MSDASHPRLTTCASRLAATLTPCAVPTQDDLVFLPSKVAKGFGEISPLLLCTRVSSALVLTDPATLRSIQIEVRVRH